MGKFKRIKRTRKSKCETVDWDQPMNRQQIKANCYWCNTLSVAFSLQDTVPQNKVLPGLKDSRKWDAFGI